MLLSESEMILSGHFFILKSKNYVNDKWMFEFFKSNNLIFKS
jgi:hypothetical protein